jgi:hypothetical protein
MSISAGAATEAVAGAVAVVSFGMRAHILLNRTKPQRGARSAGRLRGRKRHRTPAARRARWAQRALCAAALVSCGAFAQTGNQTWRDIESRIQYGYYTEDAASLRKLSETMAGGEGESHDKLRSYYAALLAWRMALLAAQPGAAAAGSTAALAHRCVDEVDGALAVEADFAEALALRSACIATPLETAGGYAPLASHRARKDLDRALQLAGRNPRVLLVDAMSDYELAPARGGNKERALTKLRQTVAAFEAERGGVEHLPGWGAAEAWLLLARDLLDHGDPLAARDALEHALLIAPEYAEARRLMAKITTG